MSDVLTLFASAIQNLQIVYKESGEPTEINDALGMLEEWREQYVEDNGQFGVGA